MLNPLAQFSGRAAKEVYKENRIRADLLPALDGKPNDQNPRLDAVSVTLQEGKLEAAYFTSVDGKQRTVAQRFSTPSGEVRTNLYIDPESNYATDQKCYEWKSTQGYVTSSGKLGFDEKWIARVEKLSAEELKDVVTLHGSLFQAAGFNVAG